MFIYSVYVYLFIYLNMYFMLCFLILFVLQNTQYSGLEIPIFIIMGVIGKLTFMIHLLK